MPAVQIQLSWNILSRKPSSMSIHTGNNISLVLLEQMSLISLQHPGRFYEELPNTADYVSYRLACNKEDYPEPYSPPINPPLSFLPQQPYQTPQTQTMPTLSSSSTSTPSKNNFLPPSHSTTVFKYPSVSGLSSPPPGVGPYTFPKEQYVWRTSLQASPLRNNRNCRSNLNEEELEFVALPLMDQRSKVTGCSAAGLLKWFVWGFFFFFFVLLPARGF